MHAIFVTGTDTGVGKTIVTGLLAKHLKERGYRVITQKWIQTGCLGNFSQDIKVHLKIMGQNKSAIKNYFPYVAPYTFKLACSAHLASKIEERKIDVNKIKNSFKLLSSHFDSVIVEGIGGVLVPLDNSRLVIDLVRELDLPILVVAQNRLGAINHTLLTLEALESRNLKIIGIVFNNPNKEKKLILKDNPRIIRALTGQKILGVLPWQGNHKKLYQRFIPIGDSILKQLMTYG